MAKVILLLVIVMIIGLFIGTMVLADTCAPTSCPVDMPVTKSQPSADLKLQSETDVESSATVSEAQKADAKKVKTAEVIKVVGCVQHSSISENNWVNTKPGDLLDEGMRIRTGFKSAVQLQLHTSALIQIQSATQIALVELVNNGDSEKTRINLKYGKIRGGILREKVTSDFQIACPTAVLTREGTWGFEMAYDPATGNYQVGLDTDGLVRVLNTVTGKRMGIVPGQFVTQAMQEWFKTAEFERMVELVDSFGVTHIERFFYAINPGGRTAIDPTGTVLASDVTKNVGAMVTQFLKDLQASIAERKRDAAAENLVNQVESRRSALKMRYGGLKR